MKLLDPKCIYAMYILEAAMKTTKNKTDKKIDLSGIYGSIPGLKPFTREEREFEDSPRAWDLLFKGD